MSTPHRATGDQLDVTTLYALLRLRVDVFVVEQESPYPDLDGRDLDPSTRHLWFADTDGEPLSYLRLLVEPDGRTIRVGRVVTRADARGKGLSRELMRAALDDIGDAPSVLDAQTTVTRFYSAFGYQVTGPEFLDGGVAHVPMSRP
ncbi:GNAT family N-acetyltransferase [Crossiella sp. SN42]|uniref:GNAT family N-acetyltransferase n=1 Tax=Crossiella sp. SN42 TaxID=2944808 RepID=UPI00207CA071|nr:GNAT family N-acetyltransferase [Crossiella sp. SN42]MCO1576581.1 GNAT family N-acetyltransferase [Crossiella sp. SN42]